MSFQATFGINRLTRKSAAVFAVGVLLCLSAGAGADQRPTVTVAASQGAGEPRVTVTGTRISQGDAVECPKVKADDGAVVGISYLPPSVAIGARVSVTGFFAVVTHCRGRVLFAETTQALDAP